MEDTRLGNVIQVVNILARTILGCVPDIQGNSSSLRLYKEYVASYEQLTTGCLPDNPTDTFLKGAGCPASSTLQIVLGNVKLGRIIPLSLVILIYIDMTSD